MHLTYFDEIKPDQKAGRYGYLIGGLVVPFALVSDIENQMNALAKEYFGHSEMTPETEFHAADIYSGKGPYKGWPSERRIELLARLATVLGTAIEGETGKVWACINTDKLRTNTDPAKAAFAYFCERVQSFIGKEGRTLLIGDLDGEESRRMIRDFSRYRSNGKTPWAYGAPIPGIVDAVHFAQSHHSRLWPVDPESVGTRADRGQHHLGARHQGERGWPPLQVTHVWASPDKFCDACGPELFKLGRRIDRAHEGRSR